MALGLSGVWVARAVKVGHDGVGAALELAPLWLSITGLVILADQTGRSALERRWPALSAVLGLSVLYDISQRASMPGGYFQWPLWLQPYAWGAINEWVTSVGWGMFVVACSALLARIGREQNWPVMQRTARVAAAAGVLIPLLFGAHRVQGAYLNSVMSTTAGNAPISLYAAAATLGFLSDAVEKAAEALLLVLALMALLLRRS
jgi:hypothetical protein